MLTAAWKKALCADAARRHTIGSVEVEEGRPDLSPALDGEEFLRWYWLKRELIAFARLHGIPAWGAKRDLQARIAAWLDGRSLPDGAPRKTVDTLPDEIGMQTLIPEGQRMTRRLREALKQAIGPEFHFDGHMRDFLSAPGGRTVLDVKREWERTRAVPREIGEQFEYNRFVKRTRAASPGATQREIAEAWAAYRALPREQREEG